jgi:NADH dehydrogenase (ubiquinone) flavoprotein 2
MTATTVPAAPGDFSFSEENDAVLRAIIAKYPEGRQASALLPALHLAQRQNGGWLSQGALDHVAAVLQMPPIRVYEVATFYTMFNLQPIGRHHLQVCTNLPCWLRGSSDILAAIRRKLEIGVGESTEDGQFTLSEVECLGACVNAPMMQVGDDYYEDLTPENVEVLLDALARGETPPAGSQTGRRGCEPAAGLTTLTELYPEAAAGRTERGGES